MVDGLLCDLFLLFLLFLSGSGDLLLAVLTHTDDLAVDRLYCRDLAKTQVFKFERCFALAIHLIRGPQYLFDLCCVDLKVAFRYFSPPIFSDLLVLKLFCPRVLSQIRRLTLSRYL